MAIKLPASCPNYARCGQTGHYYSDEISKYIRCSCMVAEVNKRKLGNFYCAKPLFSKTFLGMAKDKQSFRSDSSIELLRPHIAGVMLSMWASNHSVIAMEAYRIVEILLQTDTEFEYPNQIVTADLFILMLGFSDPRNRKLVEMILFVLGRRRLAQLPTWVILGTSLEGLAQRYESQELVDAIKPLAEVSVV